MALRLFNDSLFRSNVFSSEFNSMIDAMERQFNCPAFSDKNLTGPKINLIEQEKALKVDAEVPGFRKEALKIEFPNPTVLHLSGKVKTESTPNADAEGKETSSTEISKDKVWRRELVSRSFNRSIHLPAPIDTDGVTASLKDGLLSIVLPKLANNPKKTVQIE